MRDHNPLAVFLLSFGEQNEARRHAPRFDWKLRMKTINLRRRGGLFKDFDHYFDRSI
jgi:hypothetical protein